MNTMKTFCIILISFSLLSCKSKVNKQPSVPPPTTIKDTNIQDNKIATDTQDIQKAGASFYDWYFKNNFQYINVVKDKSGKCLLDTARYFKQLRNLNAISEKFILKEKERLKACADFMATVDYADYDAADAYEYDEYCQEFYYMYWINAQDTPDSFSTRNIKKSNAHSATLDIYVNYGKTDEKLATVHLEKENNFWKITAINKKQEESPAQEKSDISGSWQNSMVQLDIGKEQLAFLYHGQCVYFYPIRKINEKEFEMIWARDMDCKFDNGTKETFGLNTVPEIGRPFAKLKLQNNILYATYYYKEWVKKYTEQVQDNVFTTKYFRKTNNE